MDAKTYTVLFLCTGNSARSILAEALLNHHGGGRFTAYSAGSHPTGKVNAFALELLRDEGLASEGARSKSWHEFAGSDAPKMDFVFTVCGQAAGETCPVWPGHPITAHWGVDDPAAVEGSDLEKRSAFRRAYRELGTRIKLFCSLRLDQLDALATQHEVTAIGKTRADHSAE